MHQHAIIASVHYANSAKKAQNKYATSGKAATKAEVTAVLKN
jgi:hypothetical protein